MFNLYLALYVLGAIALVAGGTFQIYKMEQPIGSLLFFLGAAVIVILYGIRWFGSSGSLFSNAPVSWPPTINTCPDYLVYFGRKMPDGTTQDTCIDTIGVSKNGSIKVFPKGVQPPSSDEYYFSLSTKSSDSTAKNNELCQRAITNGLTWEGITNGESCITPSGPVAPSAGGNGSGSCPQ
jgi:hypothetical protein